LKFAYLGQNYNGYEHHVNNRTPLPTIEEELWKALVKTRLIFPSVTQSDSGNKEETGQTTQVSWEGCDYSKCGRTDRGVSAFGQVVGVRVRSNRSKERKITTPDDVSAESLEDEAAQTSREERAFDPVRDELPYVQMLNRVLPPDIRVLAWCPHPPPDFSARFSCRERRYKYFFTQPAFIPSPSDSTTREGWLDIDAMKEAASYLVGLHDFRNFCKVDATKQITNFERRIFHADIEEITSLDTPAFLRRGDLLPLSNHVNPAPKLFAFVVHGSAFLWHQVRHLVAILFLVGQGLEKPSIVRDLLDIQKMPSKPKYEMAKDAPLVLWDCIFPAEGKDQRQDSLEWIRPGDPIDSDTENRERGKWGKGGIMEDLWEVWRRRKMDEILAAALLDVVAAQPEKRQEPASQDSGAQEQKFKSQRSTRMFDGGNSARSQGKYVPVHLKPRLETVEVINSRWRERKGLSLREVEAQSSEADGND
jgi:tRNA pseudouridine38/39 synthase